MQGQLNQKNCIWHQEHRSKLETRKLNAIERHVVKLNSCCPRSDQSVETPRQEMEIRIDRFRIW